MLRITPMRAQTPGTFGAAAVNAKGWFLHPELALRWPAGIPQTTDNRQQPCGNAQFWLAAAQQLGGELVTCPKRESAAELGPSGR